MENTRDGFVVGEYADNGGGFDPLPKGTPQGEVRAVQWLIAAAGILMLALFLAARL